MAGILKFLQYSVVSECLHGSCLGLDGLVMVSVINLDILFSRIAIVVLSIYNAGNFIDIEVIFLPPF